VITTVEVWTLLGSGCCWRGRALRSEHSLI
jgi:hypothetical protein